jgi:hypothetical protein
MALTHEAAAGNPQAYIQMRAGHSQGAITERYIHAAQVHSPVPLSAERTGSSDSYSLQGGEVSPGG